MIRTAFAAAVLAFCTAPVLAQDGPAAQASAAAETFGPAVGQAAPAFSLPDSSGDMRTLAELAGPRGLVLYFNRSLDWCPICLRQTIELNEAVEAFQSAGWGVAVLTYDPVETLSRVKDQRELTMTLLSDTDSAVIDAFDVRDPIYPDPGHIAHGVPYPIAFAIRPNGTIAGKYWHEAGLGQQRGYAVRVTARDVLADLD
ncbi:MAG: peroxiredoxin family protein [Alphaproteobacteria bacterium]|nr:peroxiredoxin family protein [Alphaproteobacteria bacterium]